MKADRYTERSKLDGLWLPVRFLSHECAQCDLEKSAKVARLIQVPCVYWRVRLCCASGTIRPVH
jgi:hypothetical protein